MKRSHTAQHVKVDLAPAILRLRQRWWRRCLDAWDWDLALLPKVEDAELNQQQIAAVARASAAKLTLVRSTCRVSQLLARLMPKRFETAKERLPRPSMLSYACF